MFIEYSCHIWKCYSERRKVFISEEETWMWTGMFSSSWRVSVPCHNCKERWRYYGGTP